MTCLLVHGDCDRHRLWLWTCDPKRNVIPKNWNGIQAFVQKSIEHLKVVLKVQVPDFYWVLRHPLTQLSEQSTAGLIILW